MRRRYLIDDPRGDDFEFSARCKALKKSLNRINELMFELRNLSNKPEPLAGNKALSTTGAHTMSKSYTYRLNTYKSIRSYVTSYDSLLDVGISEHGSDDIELPVDWDIQQIAGHLSIDMDNIRSAKSKYGRDVIVIRLHQGQDFELRRYKQGRPANYLKLIVDNDSVEIDTFRAQWGTSGTSFQQNSKRSREQQNSSAKRMYRLGGHSK